MTEPLSARPEARFALVAGIAGGLAATAISVKAIFASGSSTAAIGFIFLPLVAVAAAVPAAVWGLALGCVWLSARGARRYLPAVLVMAWFAALAGPAAVGWEVWHGLALGRAVAAVSTMGPAELEEAFARSAWRRNKFFLGAIAQHERAGEALLDRIARLEDPELYDRMGSVWDVMGSNRKGLAVMRLVARNPNAGAAALEHLAARPEAEYVLSDVLANRKTPMRVLERHFGTANYLAKWGLAQNPAVPRAVLERLANDPDETAARLARGTLKMRP